MLEIEFHNREEETEEILNILNTRPDLITFVYGPINSGKSSLMLNVINKLPKNYVTFYIDLRERFVTNYEDFIKVLFEVHRTKVKDYKNFLIKALEGLNFNGIPIPKSLLIEFLKGREVEDVFEYIITVFEMLKDRNKTPVVILDELQVIGDLKIDDLLIYRLFNLFVSITKKRHLAHVFAVTSDSIFIEKVYSEAMLQGRCRYLLVDDFNYTETKEFLKKYKFNKNEIELAWKYLGGKPVYLVEAIKNKHKLKKFCEGMLRIRIRQIKDFIYKIEEEEGKNVYNKIIKLFEGFRDVEELEYEKLSREIKLCVKSNVLFVDPAKSIIKPQSKLDLIAIRKILNRLNYT